MTESRAINGKPATNGTVHFQPEKGRPSPGSSRTANSPSRPIHKEGDGTIPGKTEVVEEVPTKDGDTTSKSLIPAKFMDPVKSGLQREGRPAGYSNPQIDITNDTASIKED